jgi:hypothetical protein
VGGLDEVYGIKQFPLPSGILQQVSQVGLIIMPVLYFKEVPVSVFVERNLCAGHECSRMITPYKWFYKSDITPFVFGVFSKLIHVVTLGTNTVVETLVKIPPTNTHFSTIGKLYANIVLVEILKNTCLA